MGAKRRRRTARIAVDLVSGMLERLPALCPLDPGELLNAVWPVAVRLERLERTKPAKAAREYRALRKTARAEADRLLAMQDGASASLPDLQGTVPFLASLWRVGLTPGMPGVLLHDREAA